jgi:hypothetical protein
VEAVAEITPSALHHQEYLTAPRGRLFESQEDKGYRGLAQSLGSAGGRGRERRGKPFPGPRGRLGACPCCVPSVVRRSLGGRAPPGAQNGRIRGPVPPLPGSGFRLSVLLCRVSALTACSAQAEPGTIPGGQVLEGFPVLVDVQAFAAHTNEPLESRHGPDRSFVDVQRSRQETPARFHA